MNIKNLKFVAASVGDLSLFFGKIFLVTTFVLLGLENIFPGIVSLVFSVRAWITGVAFLFLASLLTSCMTREQKETIVAKPYLLCLGLSILFWILTSTLL